MSVMYRQPGGGYAGGGDPRRRALMDQMGQPGSVPEPPPVEAAPVPVPAAVAEPAAAAAPGPDYKSVGQYGGSLEGYDSGKLNNPDKQTAKYQIGRALSHFDPRQGMTPEAIAALNGLGIGQFSGEGDKLRVTGGTNGLHGDTDLDMVRGIKDPNSGGGWQYQVDRDDYTGGAEDQARAAVGGQMGAMGMAGGGMGRAYANSLVPTDGQFTDQMQAQMLALINGQQGPVTRSALLDMMGKQANG